MVSVHKIFLLKGICTKVGECFIHCKHCPSRSRLLSCPLTCIPFTGVQVLRRNYNFSDALIFTSNDIVGLFPVVTHAAPKVCW